MTTATKTRSSRYRTPAVKGYGESIGVDRKNEVIRGVVVMEIGDISQADVRKQFTDATTFEQYVQFANAATGGTKARFTHPDASNDGLGSYLGRWRNARIDGNKVRQDLHLSPRSHDSPTHGDIGKYVMDFAESDPDMFATSMVVLLDHDAMKKEQRDDGYSPIRLKSVSGTDVVDEGALTGGGFFSTKDTLLIPDKAASMLDQHYAGLSAEEIRERAAGFLDRYFHNRFGEQFMTTTAKPNEAAATGVSKQDLEAILATFSTTLLSKVDEKLAALKPGEKPADTQPTPEDIAKGAVERFTKLSALAANAGLKDHEKVAKSWYDKGLSFEHAELAVQSLMVGGNTLSKDSGQGDADPDAVYKAEYQKSIAAFSSMGLSLQEYITSRKIDDKSEVLAAKVA